MKGSCWTRKGGVGGHHPPPPVGWLGGIVDACHDTVGGLVGVAWSPWWGSSLVILKVQWDLSCTYPPPFGWLGGSVESLLGSAR